MYEQSSTFWSSAILKYPDVGQYVMSFTYIRISVGSSFDPTIPEPPDISFALKNGELIAS